MSQKRILIVDDEESILTVLKNSLKKLGGNYQVVTVKDGFAALDRLLEQPFDVVVTDFNMVQMDGLELMEAVKYAQPNAKLIMITAYGTKEIEAEVKRLHAFKYLTKPLEINAFRKIIKEALGAQETTLGPAKLTVLSNKKYRQICDLLARLRSEVSAQCIFLTDSSGHLVAQTGDTEKIPIENIASLLGGGMATVLEAGKTLDGDTDAVNLVYRESDQQYLYAVNVGSNMLLIIVVSRGPYSSRLGSVWYNAQQAVVTLRDQLTQEDRTMPQQVFNENMNQAFDEELSKLFSGNDTF